ncbi:Hypothetical protein SMAX5B_017372 [Scophthalmus maximus]|uniref:Uncharacterized protein n=1 Tax=Scophthalmus maximus TaxID=52904 RepID=A0A2U9CTR2_SCOMX|nr:Hypothetical protein SMAX5B_017372 [Scophthalmus maximus]
MTGAHSATVRNTSKTRGVVTGFEAAPHYGYAYRTKSHSAALLESRLPSRLNLLDNNRAEVNGKCPNVKPSIYLVQIANATIGGSEQMNSPLADVVNR